MEILSTDTSNFNILTPDLGTIPTTEDSVYDNELLREYVITLKNYDDLDTFYDDMETPGGDLYIPDRAVDVADKRPISRNTHYFLTQFEAEQIKQDPRVQAVDLTYAEKGIEIKPASQFSNNWSKVPQSSTAKNWGVYRSYIGSTIADWGMNGTFEVSDTINLTNIGRNVDVVICDGHIKPGHPEYAVNEDGSGGSRVIQYNWFQHNPTVRGVSYPASTYQYTFPTAGNSYHSHGMHVAGIAAGNTQGWARGANIYNIYPYTVGNDNTFNNWTYYVIDYIRAFHNAKPVNPATGIKNPTIVNMSWSLTSSYDLTTIKKINFQGVSYSKPTGAASTYWNQFKGFLGLVATDSNNSNVVLSLTRDNALDADVSDALNSGIIIVGAAGNYYMYNDVSTGTNYNNGLYTANPGYLDILNFYHRGGSPAAAPGVINVSSVDSTVEERKADYSNAGPRTDIFAPGTAIISSTLGPTSIVDSRNSSYYLQSMNGTSMASPQVTGVLACALEAYPRMKPTEALAYLTEYATKNQLSNPANPTDPVSTLPLPFINYNGLLNSPNYYLKYPKEKLDYGLTYPKQNYGVRPTNNITYPRFKRRLKG